MKMRSAFIEHNDDNKMNSVSAKDNHNQLKTSYLAPSNQYMWFIVLQ
jgi:hypothetical protein